MLSHRHLREVTIRLSSPHSVGRSWKTSILILMTLSSAAFRSIQPSCSSSSRGELAAQPRTVSSSLHRDPMTSSDRGREKLCQSADDSPTTVEVSYDHHDSKEHVPKDRTGNPPRQENQHGGT